MTQRKSLLPIDGSYLVWGVDREPELHLLDPVTRGFYLNRRTDDNPYVRADAVPSVFGPGFTEVYSLWNETDLRIMGEHYEGPQQDNVRAYCAAMVLGITFEELAARRRKGGSGGSGDRITRPKKPIRPQPGVAVAVAS